MSGDINSKPTIAYEPLKTVHKLWRGARNTKLKALYFPAVAALRFNPLIQQKSIRWTVAGKRKMQIIAAAMHHLLRLAFGVRKNQKPFNAEWKTKKAAEKQTQEI